MNRFLDQCRSAHGRRPDSGEDVSDEGARGGVPDWAEVGAAEFHAAVDALEPDVREVFRLRIVDRLSYQAIAERLGVPVATVGARLTGARTGIRGVLRAHRPAVPVLRREDRRA